MSEERLPGGMTREQLAAIALDPLVQAAAMQDRDEAASRRVGDFEATVLLDRGSFDGFLKVTVYGGITGFPRHGFVLSPDEARNLRTAITAALGDEPVSETFEHGGWRVTAEPHTGGLLQLWQRDDDGEWIDVGWNTTPDGLRDLIAVAAAALGDGVIVVSRERLRDALAESFVHGCSRGNVMPLGDQVTNWTEQALKRLTAPEVEG